MKPLLKIAVSVVVLISSAWPAAATEPSCAKPLERKGEIRMSAEDLGALAQVAAEARAKGFDDHKTEASLAVKDGRLVVAFLKLPVASGGSIEPTPFGPEGNATYEVVCGRIAKTYFEK